MRVELNRQVELRKFQKERQEYEKEGKSFAKPKSTIEGQRDSEAGDVDKGRRWDSKTQEERAEIKEVGDKKAEIVQEKKREQERETDVTLSNRKINMNTNNLCY